jgi:metallo-beta-lactamase family protein
MKIEFHGADRDVTGSCHLIEAGGAKLLIDCGLYQGGREMAEENAEPFGFAPGEIDYVLLTHAHLDHCGRLPLLVKRGFQGEILTTSASRELARLVLLDAAHLQEEEARYQSRRAARRGEGRAVLPLYDSVDALYTFDFFGRTMRYDKPLQIANGITATFIDAGHILGSASILLEFEAQGRSKRILFSGDLGYSDRAIIRDPAPPPHADYVVMETTYGDRRHKTLEPSLDELYQVINDALERGGNVIIPTFALERAQELLYYLREGVRDNRLPKYMPLFLDSPMAISATEIFQHHPECYDEETCALFEAGNDPFALPGLRFTRETAESMALNQITGGAVIMAGSGMCTGGRVRHHLKHNLWRKESAIVFVGYAARGTLARRIIDGAKKVRIYSDEIHVNASIHTIGGFSAHADQQELLDWYHHTGGPKRTFLVHGDEDAMRCFGEKLTGTQVEMPALHQGYRL